jgi:hypothetical protein
MIEGRDPDHAFAQGGRGHFDCFRYVAPNLQALASIRHSLDTQEQRLNAAGA